MIFGKSYSQKNIEKQKNALRKMQGVRKFALLPVALENGQWLCFQSYWRYYIGYASWDTVNRRWGYIIPSVFNFRKRYINQADPLRPGHIFIKPVDKDIEEASDRRIKISLREDSESESDSN